MEYFVELVDDVVEGIGRQRESECPAREYGRARIDHGNFSSRGSSPCHIWSTAWRDSRSA